jgi:hypothetical protein
MIAIRLAADPTRRWTINSWKRRLNRGSAAIGTPCHTFAGSTNTLSNYVRVNIWQRRR